MLPREMKPSIEVHLPGATARLIRGNYHRYNALQVKNATYAYKHLLDTGGKMFLAMAGASSTARLGISIAKMIYKGYISGISCTGANLEEDVFNLIGLNDAKIIPNYKDLTPEDDEELNKKKHNRVTDGTISAETMKKVENLIIEKWEISEERKFPFEFLGELLLDGRFEEYYQTDPNESWLLAAMKMKIPIVTPGNGDSTLGQVFSALIREMEVDPNIMKNDYEALNYLGDWYLREKADKGFFQIGGGIAGDFSICVVPWLRQDCQMGNKVKHWAYLTEITDADPTYGGYSGAEASEKISWDKINKDTPTFIIKSDATIVVPLIFNAILGE